jgi:hypothetical protein
LAAFLLKLFNDEWWWLLFIAAIGFLLEAFIMFFFLIPEPELVGIIIDEHEGLVEPVMVRN